MGFYLFSLPFYQLLQGSLVFVTVLAIVAVVFQYVFFGLMRLEGGRQIETRGMRFRIFPCFFSSWLLPLDRAITLIGTTFCIRPWAWSMELDIRQIM